MAKSSSTYTLGTTDTISYADDVPHIITLFQRDGDAIVGIKQLKASFEHSWQSAMTRKAILASGKIDLANWQDANPYTPPSF